MNKFDIQTKPEELKQYQILYDHNSDYSPFSAEFASDASYEYRNDVQRKIEIVNAMLRPLLSGLVDDMSYRPDDMLNEIPHPGYMDRSIIRSVIETVDELGIDRDIFNRHLFEMLTVSKFRLSGAICSFIKLRNATLCELMDLDRKIHEENIMNRITSDKIDYLVRRIEELESRAGTQ